jgi:hypothetical protein
MEEARRARIRLPLPRFSLLTALLLMTILGLAIVVAQLWWEVGPLREELVQLRNETGRLTIDDETKLHAIEVRTDEDRTWKWRVWVPEGQRVVAHSQWGNVPRNGVPAFQNTVALEPGEQWITLSARRDQESGHWLGSLATKQGNVGNIIQPTEHWFDWKQSTATSDGVSHTTTVAPDDQDVIVLKRYRTAQVDNSNELNKIEGPTAGFIIWLERQ